MSINFENLKAETWTDIDANGDASSGYKGTYITDKNYEASDILIFKDEKRNLHLVIAAKDINKEDITDPKVNGLDLKILKYRFEDIGVAQFIDLECSHQAYKEEFTEIVREISGRIIVQKQSPTVATLEVISNWKSFWGRPPKEILSDEEQIGLLCELMVLRHLCETSPSTALDSWRGPLGEKYDFVLSNKVIEVKGTRAEERTHIINGIDQLAIPEDKNLFFISYLASKTQNDSSASLPEVISEIENKELNNRPALIQKLYNILAYTGYNPVHREDYRNFTFDIYDGRLFSVDETFPNLTSEDLKKTLDNRITELNYRIKLEGIQSQPVEDFRWQI